MQVESVLGGIRNDWEVRAVMCAFAGLMEVTCERFVTDVLSRRFEARPQVRRARIQQRHGRRGQISIHLLLARIHHLPPPECTHAFDPGAILLNSLADGTSIINS